MLARLSIILSISLIFLTSNLGWAEEPSLTILYTNDVSGYLAPCG